MSRGKEASANEKTTQEFWSEWWEGKTTLPARVRHWTIANRKLDRMFRRFLPEGRRKLLEIGCAPGARLVYFNERFGYDIFGVEYTRNGYLDSVENLRLQQVPGEILHEDIFSTGLPADFFDVVFSNGLVEHFEDPYPMMEAHVRLTKPGGLVLLLVPTQEGIVKLLQGWADRTQPKVERRVLPSYRRLTPADFKGFFDRLNVEPIHIGYFGGLNLMAIHWQKFQSNRLFILGMHALNQLLGWLIPVNFSFLAPYVLAVGRKR